MEVLTEWIEGTGGVWTYILVFAGALIENVFTPLPGDTATVFGAYLGGLGRLSFIGIHLAATAGGTLGFMAQYAIGRYIRRRGEIRGRALGIKINSVEKVGVYFRRWGYWVILLNRFLYGMRFFVGIFSGMFNLPWKLVLLLAFAGGALWNLILVHLGMTLGKNWAVFKEIMWKYNRFALAAIIIVIIGFLLWKLYLSKFRFSGKQD